MAKVLGKGESVRARAVYSGIVQGVGFRPHVFRLAERLKMGGSVSNAPEGVVVEAEGDSKRVGRFLEEIGKRLPPHSSIASRSVEYVSPLGEKRFVIGSSANKGEIAPMVLPDLAICSECLKELLDPDDRRYRYPFINCTHCGPRFSILRSLPYDRPNTTMSGFRLCPDCQAEYDDPRDRRFHAQPNACPVCGPRLTLIDRLGNEVAEREEALSLAAREIRAGGVVAVKGLGGFHLMVDAANRAAVDRLRERKNRKSKPFALMCLDVATAAKLARLRPYELAWLQSPERPIVLVDKRVDRLPGVASDSARWGVMLPYAPLHVLLLNELGVPLVATSGNRADEPICIDNVEALERLGGIADWFLVHDRPIERPVEDSIVQACGREIQILRRARGYAPLPISIGEALPPSVAFGGYLKNAVAFGKDRRIVLGPHIGDLDTTEAVDQFGKSLTELSDLFAIVPKEKLADRHPDYPSSEIGPSVFPRARLRKVQHHRAHVYACMADRGLVEPLLGVSWDGTGLGDDGTIWGGEFFLVADGQAKRFAGFLPFPLPGGDAAAREPRRTALGMRRALDVSDRPELRFMPLFASFEPAFLRVAESALDKNLNTPICSSAGRIFDGFASLLGLRQCCEYEGEAAMALQYAAERSLAKGKYRFGIEKDVERDLWILDWRPMFVDAWKEFHETELTEVVARKIHLTLAEMIVAVAKLAKQPVVALTGGCFQNRLLAKMAAKRLGNAGYEVYQHRSVPPNDGGLAAGQVFALTQMKEGGGSPCA